jgi:hypothetical protein
MADAGLIEVGGPCVELSAAAHLEGDVIKAGPQRIKGIATAARVFSQPAKEAAVRMEQQDPGDPGITGRDLELLDEAEARHALVPVGADPHVPDRERHVRCSFEGGHRPPP